MLDKVRPGEWVSPDRRRYRASNPLLNQNPKSLQTGRRYRPNARRLSHDWRANWRPIGEIVTETVLPQIRLARERDRKVRAPLNLPFIDWDGQS